MRSNLGIKSFSESLWPFSTLFCDQHNEYMLNSRLRFKRGKCIREEHTNHLLYLNIARISIAIYIPYGYDLIILFHPIHG